MHLSSTQKRTCTQPLERLPVQSLLSFGIFLQIYKSKYSKLTVQSKGLLRLYAQELKVMLLLVKMHCPGSSQQMVKLIYIFMHHQFSTNNMISTMDACQNWLQLARKHSTIRFVMQITYYSIIYLFIIVFLQFFMCPASTTNSHKYTIVKYEL